MCSRIDRASLALLLALTCAQAAPVAAAQSRRTLADLGRFEPPAYADPLTRSDDPSDVFDEALAAYGRRQFDRAADLLRRFVAAAPDDVPANFFLAASLMMTDEVGEAEDRLGAVLNAGDTPFATPARFALAKALIRLGRLDAAERELVRAAGEEGPYARASGDLLPRVRAAKKRR